MLRAAGTLPSWEPETQPRSPRREAGTQLLSHQLPLTEPAEQEAGSGVEPGIWRGTWAFQPLGQGPAQSDFRAAVTDTTWRFPQQPATPRRNQALAHTGTFELNGQGHGGLLCKPGRVTESGPWGRLERQTPVQLSGRQQSEHGPRWGWCWALRVPSSHTPEAPSCRPLRVG